MNQNTYTFITEMWEFEHFILFTYLQWVEIVYVDQAMAIDKSHSTNDGDV